MGAFDLIWRGEQSTLFILDCFPANYLPSDFDNSPVFFDSLGFQNSWKFHLFSGIKFPLDCVEDDDDDDDYDDDDDGV